MSVYLNKLRRFVRKHYDFFPVIFYAAVIMFMLYAFMIVGCALDDACYEVHMRSIQEVPYVYPQE